MVKALPDSHTVPYDSTSVYMVPNISEEVLLSTKFLHQHFFGKLREVTNFRAELHYY